MVKKLPASARDMDLIPWEVPLEKEMATHYSILAWEIPGTEKSSGLQSMGSQRVGHNLVTKQQQSLPRHCGFTKKPRTLVFVESHLTFKGWQQNQLKAV